MGGSADKRWRVPASPELALGPKLIRSNGLRISTATNRQRMGLRSERLRLRSKPLQGKPHVRPLYADRVARHQRTGLRGRARRQPGNLGLRIFAAGELSRNAPILTPALIRYQRPHPLRIFAEPLRIRSGGIEMLSRLEQFVGSAFRGFRRPGQEFFGFRRGHRLEGPRYI